MSKVPDNFLYVLLKNRIFIIKVFVISMVVALAVVLILPKKYTVTTVILPPEEQASLDALNTHTEDCARRLQPAFRSLIVEMLELKREHYTGG